MKASRTTSRRRRAFTLIELMLALSLAGLLMASITGLLFMLYTSQSRVMSASKNATDTAVAQTILRRAMNSLVAGIPRPEEETEQEDAEEEENGEEGEEAAEEEADEPSLEELFQGAFDDPALAASVLAATQPADIHFELYYEDMGEAGIQPLLTVVTSESPAPRTRSLLATDDEVFEDRLAALDEEEMARRRAREALAGPVRGALEVARRNDSLVLQWAWPDDPYMEPFVLIRNIEAIQWEVLVKENPEEDISDKIWTDVHAAYLPEDFPYAVRLTFTTTDGRFVDWIFETAVLVPEPGA